MIQQAMTNYHTKNGQHLTLGGATGHTQLSHFHSDGISTPFVQFFWNFVYVSQFLMGNCKPLHSKHLTTCRCIVSLLGKYYTKGTRTFAFFR